MNYLLNILSEDRKGLMSIITSMLNRKSIEIESISAAKTDIHTQVLINIEVIANDTDIKLMAFKIENIIEVYKVEVELLQHASYQKLALYTLHKDGYNTKVNNQIQKYGAIIVGYDHDVITIQKSGRDEDIQLLYNELEGKYLKSFSKSAVISLKAISVDDDTVISKAA
jgi:acetolactate synthase-1/3 small subunit